MLRKNFKALQPLIDQYPDRVMFCSDDKHPDDLIKGHINQLAARAIKEGCDLYNVLRAACLTPIIHYNLPVGLLRTGDSADFIIVDDLENFKVRKAYINGEEVFSDGKCTIERVQTQAINNFNCKPITAESIQVKAQADTIQVIEALDGELITNRKVVRAKVQNDKVVSDLSKDILKLVVVNRYSEAKPAVGFVNGFGLQAGALASSVAHDSHNIIAVGTSDDCMVKAINLVIENQGGISCVNDSIQRSLALPVAGLMSLDKGEEVAAKYEELDRFAKELGSTLKAPYMTLSFLALLVIPHLKLGDKGLFDVDKFTSVNLFTES